MNDSTHGQGSTSGGRQGREPTVGGIPQDRLPPDPARGDGADEDALSRFYGKVENQYLAPLWRIGGAIMPPEPRPAARPWLWRFSTLKELAREAGDLVPISRGGDRRVLACVNPGLWGRVQGATSTLWAAVQYLLPGESAPGHRHSASALRFVVDGKGAWTTVDGERLFMSPGDLVLTPAQTWHDHENPGDEPMVWFDGLDLPLTAYLDAGFIEPYEDGRQAVLDTHASERAFRSAGLIPERPPSAVEGEGATDLPDGLPDPPRLRHSRLMRYPWERTAEALEALREEPGDPHDDLLLRYTDPETGGPVLPTLDATVQLLRQGASTRPHRHVHSTVYQVFRGEGETVVDGLRFRWRPGDILAIPPWALHEHRTPDQEAILFAITDEPVIEALGYQREATVDEPQRVEGDFDPEGS